VPFPEKFFESLVCVARAQPLTCSQLHSHERDHLAAPFAVSRHRLADIVTHSHVQFSMLLKRSDRFLDDIIRHGRFELRQLLSHPRLRGVLPDDVRTSLTVSRSICNFR
jgi:hypothetical protein